MQFKGTLDECKTKCGSINDCQVFNREKNALDNNSSECILKKTYQNKEGVCVPDSKYVSYSRGGQIKFEIVEKEEKERIERERIERERIEREERERKERERIERERREREERERREREEIERREREERERREREERERNERERNMIVYNGNTYKTLADWDKNDYNVTCQNSGWSGQQSWIQIPKGWCIAPDNQDSIQAIKSKPWKTHVLVLANGNSYWTATVGASFWNSAQIRTSEGNYMPGNCHLGIFLIKKRHLYTIDSPSIPSLLLSNFPKLGSLNKWELNINFICTGNWGNWRALIGNMYNSTVNRGWGVWVSSSNSIHFSWSSITWEPGFRVELNRHYSLSIYRTPNELNILLIRGDNGEVQTATNTDMRDTNRYKMDTNGPVTIGGWQNYNGERFPGYIYKISAHE
jgi:hypothetical protein